MPFRFVVILFGLLLIVGIIVLLRRSVAARWVGLALLGILLLVGVFLVGVRRKQVFREVQQEAVLGQHAAVRSVVEPGWEVTGESPFEADVYASLASAAKALGRRGAEGLSEATGEDREAAAVVIQVADAGGRLTSEAAGPLQEGWRGQARREPKVLVEKTGRPMSADPNVITGLLTLAPLGGVHAQPAEGQRSGTLTLTLRGPGVQVSRETSFVEKPWVENFSAFVNRQPGKQWLIAQSSRPCTSAEEAHREALSQAEALLYSRIRPYVRPSTPGRWGGENLDPDEAVRQVIRAHVQAANNLADATAQERPHIVTRFGRGRVIIQAEGLVQDRFVQQFKLGYGEVWREAMLLDGSPAQVERIAQVCAAESQAGRVAWLGRVGSIVGLLAAICIIYGFLNAATRGYYTWALRIGAAAAGGAVLWFVLRLS